MKRFLVILLLVSCSVACLPIFPVTTIQPSLTPTKTQPANTQIPSAPTTTPTSLPSFTPQILATPPITRSSTTSNSSTPTRTRTTTRTGAVVTSATSSLCLQGCMTPPPNCLIKGNISSDKEKIYHVPGGAAYAQTDIDSSKGERWFCTEAEANANGWRRSQR